MRKFKKNYPIIILEVMKMPKKEEKEAKKNYDYMAEYYHDIRTKRNPEGWFYNELLEMPATLELLGNIKEKKILDFGCGTGIYAKILSNKCAKVKGFDISPKMLEIAKRNNLDLDFRLGSGYKIPFKEKFDVVNSSLVVHYLDNWDKMLKEVKRVLKKGGYFVFSTGNPVTESSVSIKKGKNKKKRILGDKDYFKDKKVSAIWDLEEKGKLKITSYHRTYESIIKTIIRNGFEIIDYKDCFPLKKSKKLYPEHYAIWSKIPIFCVWKLKLK